MKHFQAETTVGVADSSYNRPLYVSGNRLGLSATAVALTCLTEELIPSSDGGPYHRHILVPLGFAAPLAFEPRRRGHSKLAGGEAVTVLVVICVTEGLWETSPDSEPV